ncbi:hypothetical protein PPYR_15710, partial [Photinus pyralis]
DAKPGFTTEAFNFLKLKVAKSNKKEIVCSLVFDEMSIRQHVEFCNGKYFGYVDFGSQLEGDNMEMAKEALVFMIVCINEPWKLPIGYFFLSAINSNQKATLTKQALTLLNDTGIKIMNMTFDGAATNFGMCSVLKCPFKEDNIRSVFIHDDRKYFLMPDPVHMIKLIRNCFTEKMGFIDLNGNQINFEYVIKLNEMQEKEGLHLGNKLRKQHINFVKQKMKVKLARQLLSRSVADALFYCRDKLQMAEFNNCGPTAEFILLMKSGTYKQATCPTNIEEIRRFYTKLCK